MLFARSDNHHWSHTVRHFLLDGFFCVVGFWAAMVVNNGGVMGTLLFAYQRGQERGDW